MTPVSTCAVDLAACSHIEAGPAEMSAIRWNIQQATCCEDCHGPLRDRQAAHGRVLCVTCWTADLDRDRSTA